MEIGLPVALVKLPKPINNGKVHFGPVWTLKGGAKKRRHEVCAAIDGNSVNIYEIQHGRNLLSCAIPPTRTFACPPVANRVGRTEQSVYYVTTDDGTTIMSSANNSHQVRSVVLAESCSTVVHLGLVAVGKDVSILVVQADGTFTLASSDLQDTNICKLQSPSTASRIHILAAAVVSRSDARKTVLKSRVDIFQEVAEDAPIIAAAYTVRDESQNSYATSELHYAAWSISKHSENLTTSLLFDHQLCPSALKKGTYSNFTFDLRASTLSLRSSKAIQRYDLTLLVPRLLPEIRLGLQNQQDVEFLSQGLAIVADQDTLHLVDQDYGVPQAILDLNQTILRRKRKRSGSNVHNSGITFVSHFNQTHRILLYSRSLLVACDIKMSWSDMHNSSLLANNVGRGLRKSQMTCSSLSVSFGQGTKTSADDERWPNVRSSLRALADAGRAVEFEAKLLSYLRKQRSTRGESGQSMTDLQANQILSLLFDVKPRPPDAKTGQNRLHLTLVVPAVIHWLNEHGFLSKHRLERCLEGDHPSAHISLDFDTIVQAMFDADSDMKTFSAYVSSSATTDILIQAAIVRLLLRQTLGRTALIVKTTTATTSSEKTQSIVIADPKNQVSSTADDQEFESILTLLTVALANLSKFSVKSISRVLTPILTGEEVLAVIQLLRQHLFQSGYPGSISQSQAEENVALRIPTQNSLGQTSSQELGIESVLKLLSACINLLGPVDLLSTKVADDFLEDVIPDLLSEISLASQTAQESADLQGTMRETLRHDPSPLWLTHHTNDALTIGSPVQRPGSIVTLYSEDVEDGSAVEQIGCLPLGSNPSSHVNPMKVRKGGGQTSKRSLRETLMLASMQRKMYSFDRLVL